MSADVPWRTVKVLSFDVYGTLVDQNMGVTAAARGTSLKYFLPNNDNQILEGLRQHSSNLEQDFPSMRKSAINAEALRRYANDLQVIESGKVSADEIDRAASDYGQQMGSYPAFADTVEALERLRQRYKLIALSNVDHSSFNEALSKQFKGNPFHACYVAEDIGSYKPDLNNFKYLLNHTKEDFNLEPNELCHIAQGLYVDHTATKKMGIRSVWVDRYDILGSSGRTADDMQQQYGYRLRVKNLKELADIVDRAFDER